MKKLLLTLSFILATLACKANGDPVLWSSALTLSSCPQARHIPEIMLTDEHLEVTANGPTSHIRVTYILTNTSNKAFTGIDYGFPVDWYGSGKTERSWNDYVTESQRIYGWNDAYVKDVHFAIDDNNLSWKCSADTILTKAIKMEDLLTPEEKELPEEQLGDTLENRWLETYGADITPLYDLCRRWYYTSFDFAPKQQRTLTVEYTIANNYTVSLYGQGEKTTININDPTTFAGKGRAEIAYDFTPSSSWGNGHAGNFNIELLLNNAEIDHRYNPIYNDWADKFQTTPDSTCWTFSTKDFDLATAEPLYASYRFSPKAKEEAQAIESLKSIYADEGLEKLFDNEWIKKNCTERMQKKLADAYCYDKEPDEICYGSWIIGGWEPGEDLERKITYIYADDNYDFHVYMDLFLNNKKTGCRELLFTILFNDDIPMIDDVEMVYNWMY